MANILSFLWTLILALTGKGTATTTAAASESATATTTTTAAAVKEAAETAAKYTESGDASVDGIYAHFAEGDVAATKPYEKIDPSQYPDVWVRRTGIALGNVVYALRVDGRAPGKDEYKSDDVDAIGEHGNVVLTYPKYAPYRTAGTHEVVVLVGRVQDDETDPTTMEILHEYAFDVTVVKAAE